MKVFSFVTDIHTHTLKTGMEESNLENAWPQRGLSLWDVVMMMIEKLLYMNKFWKDCTYKLDFLFTMEY
jgi:hypothetical protein